MNNTYNRLLNLVLESPIGQVVMHKGQAVAHGKQRPLKKSWETGEERTAIRDKIADNKRILSRMGGGSVKSAAWKARTKGTPLGDIG